MLPHTVDRFIDQVIEFGRRDILTASLPDCIHGAALTLSTLQKAAAVVGREIRLELV